MTAYARSPEYSHTFAGADRIEPLTGIRRFAALAVFFSRSPVGDKSGFDVTFPCLLGGYQGVEFALEDPRLAWFALDEIEFRFAVLKG